MSMRIIDEFTSHGRFWLPETPNQTIAGRFAFKPDEGPSLELSESFTSGSSPVPPSLLSPGEYPVLHGQLLRGDLITLFGCIVKSRSLGAGMGSPVQIVANRALVGCLLVDADQDCITACNLGFTSFENWMSMSPVTYEYPSDGGRNLGIDVKYRFPEPVIIAVPAAGFTLEICQTLHTNPGIASFSLDGSGYLRITLDSPVKIDRVFELAWQFQNLLSLLIGTPVGMTYCELRMLTGSASSNRREGMHDLLFEQVFQQAKDEIHPMMMLLPLATIRADFPAIVERWISRVKLSKAAMDVYFGSLYQPSPVLNFKFLAVTQAIESYHRSLGTGLYMDADEYQKAIQPLLSNMPDEIRGDHRQSLKNRLKYGNEYSLRKRLTLMLEALPVDLQQLVAGDVGRFVQRIVDTRNYFTHYDDASKGAALENVEIHFAAERLRILMVITLFVDLGVSASNLTALLKRNPDFRHTLSQPI